MFAKETMTSLYVSVYCVEERLLAQALVERLIVVDRGVGEHLGVGLEANAGARAVGVADYGHRLGDIAPRELHAVDLAVLVDIDLEPLGEGVDDRRADAVQAAGDLVSAAAEFAARVQDGEDDLKGALARLLLDIDGDASAVIRDGYHVARLNGDLDMGAVARESLVYRVVDYFIYKMVQAGGAGRADIHTRSLADSLKTLEYLDLTCVIILRDGRIHLAADGYLFGFKFVIILNIQDYASRLHSEV